MSISGYITVPQFTGSVYYGGLSIPCSLSGAVGTYVQELIDMATSLIDNYLGYSLWSQSRKETFRGNGIEQKYLSYFPVNSITSVTYQRVRENYYGNGYYSQPISVTSGVVNSFYLIDENTGLVEIDGGFMNNYRYTVNYVAGRTTIPDDIKTVTKILVAQISLQIDTGNMANADLSYDNVKMDSVSFSFGGSKIIKNMVIKDVNDLQALPATVYPILNRYKYSSLV